MAELRRATEDPARCAEVRFGEQVVVYALDRRRRRSIGFIVGPTGLKVHAPNGLGHAAIDAALQAKSAWILAKLAEQRERAQRAEAARIAWCDGCCLPYLGRPLVVTLDPASRAARLETAAAGAAAASAADATGQALPDSAAATAPWRLRLPLPADASAAAIGASARRWLQAEARRLFAERCACFAPRLGVQPRAIRLSSARTRWGSASVDGTLRLNRRLVHLPLACIDYVVVHELAHLREMNHGPRFWALVGGVLPEYPAVRRALREVNLPALD